VHKSQDLHTMLDCLLESYKDVQKSGFIWDLRYRGRTYKDVEFVPFVMFIKCDTDEGDQLCGAYTSRGNGVSQLCRRCTCPTLESDLVRVEYPPKTTKMISSLVEAGDGDALRVLSQQNIKNAWYQIRFHPSTAQGIHGACPSEMLHAILLGIFKYTRDCFFAQIGKTSGLADAIDDLSQNIGDHFGRQSERDMPKCKFKQGIRRGKIMAKEFRGILLVMAAILRCRKGRDLLRNNQSFQDDDQKDWVLLVETLLQWEAFLNEPEMSVQHIRRLRQKNVYVMYLFKKVVRRTEGMGLKLTKFHMITHLWHDILLYGVPLEVDTGSNESHHKKTKVAARLTQKNEATLDLQTCTRLDEFFLVELAQEEINGKRLCHYFDRLEGSMNKELATSDEELVTSSVKKEEEDFETADDESRTLGGHIAVERMQQSSGGNYDAHVYWHGREGQRKQWKEPGGGNWDVDVVSFLIELQDKLNLGGNNRLQIRAEHRRGAGIIFRGHPSYRGKPWTDWAMFDWGDVKLPGQIWCFVVIDSILQRQDEVMHGGITLCNGTYAVIESCVPDNSADEKRVQSDMFVPYKKEVLTKQSATLPWKRNFYLADVDSIVDPLVVIPNVGGRTGTEQLLVKPRSEWVDDFKKWLAEPHNRDVIGEDDPMPSHNVAT